MLPAVWCAGGVLPTPRTRADEVYGGIRADILAGRRRPGSRLPFAELCAYHRASASVVREGLARLAEEGLVVAHPQRGFRVVPLAADDLRDLTEVRRLNESLALGSAVADGDAAWEARVALAHARLERTPQPAVGDPDRMDETWVEAHNAFHAALLSGCRNRRLLAIALAARDASVLYQRWTRSVGHDRDRDAPAEHRAMLDAALARDPDRAVAVLHAHIDRTAAVLIAALEDLPPGTAPPDTAPPDTAPRDAAVRDVAL